MVYIDLPPAAETPPDSSGTPPAGQAPLSVKRAWRREQVIRQLSNPHVVAESVGLLEQQVSDIRSAFAPRNGWQDWLTSTIATIMLRINRSERIERKLRDWASYRAIDFWEDDQKLAVETIALRIGHEPARVVAKLRETPAGIDWLLARWRLLEPVEPIRWTDLQRDLAAQLTGGAAVDPAGPGFVAATIADLTAYRARVVEADAITRGLVEADLNDDAVAGLARLRRYVRSLHRQLKWYVDQFHVEHPDRWDDPRRRPAIHGPAVEAYRPRNPNHFEGVAQPLIPEPSLAPVAAPAAETKPTTPRSPLENTETKPFAPVPASPIPVPPPVVHDYATERGRHHSRPHRAGDPSREYARRQKAARRRTDLALAEIT